MQEPETYSIQYSHAEGACLTDELAHCKLESDISSISPLLRLYQRPTHITFLVSVSASLFMQWVQRIYFQDISGALLQYKLLSPSTPALTIPLQPPSLGLPFC